MILKNWRTTIVAVISTKLIMALQKPLLRYAHHAGDPRRGQGVQFRGLSREVV